MMPTTQADLDRSSQQVPPSTKADRLKKKLARKNKQQAINRKRKGGK